MPQPQLPQGRVLDTSYRDLTRSLIRAADPEPARPTKTVAAPEGLMAMSAMSAGAPQVQGLAALTSGVPLPGGWSLQTDPAGNLIFVHEDGSTALAAQRTMPAPTGEDQVNG